jgi:biotin operon repressor
VTHNEPVSRDDLACALGISGAHAWAIANALQTLGYAQLDDRQGAVEATPAASDSLDTRDRDEALLALKETE